MGRGTEGKGDINCQPQQLTELSLTVSVMSSLVSTVSNEFTNVSRPASLYSKYSLNTL